LDAAGKNGLWVTNGTTAGTFELTGISGADALGISPSDLTLLTLSSAIDDFLGTGTSDVLFRNDATGDTGFYAIVNGVNTGWHDVGASSTAYYSSTPDATPIELKLIEPLGRYHGYEMDFRGFHRARMVKILAGFVVGDTIEAPKAIELPDGRSLFRYRICNGLHRYFASIAAGYSEIPLRF
jgi:hypothetical protein